MISIQDHRFFSVAKAVALTSSHAKALIGSVIVQGKEILSVGVNGLKSHPLQQKYNQLRFRDHRCEHLMHAELDAIIKARRYLSENARIYTVRVLKSGDLGMCRPCKACMTALNDFDINRIFYTTEQGFAYEEVN